jgi:sugar phosphate isomerase/epimerase
LQIGLKTHWTGINALLKRFKSVAPFAIEFHEDELDIDNKERYQNQIRTIISALSGYEGALAFHVPFLDTDPASLSESRRKEAIRRIKKTLDLALVIKDKIGLQYMLVNTHFYSMTPINGLLTLEMKRVALSTAKESWDMIKSYAKEKGVVITVENLTPHVLHDRNFYGILDRCAEDIIERGSDICLDISHAYMTCYYFANKGTTVNLPGIGTVDVPVLPDVELDIKYRKGIPPSVRSLPSFIRHCKPRIRHVHLGDAIGYYYEGLILGKGDVEWETVFDLLPHDKNVIFVIEIKDAHLYPQRIEKSLKFLKSKGYL